MKKTVTKLIGLAIVGLSLTSCGYGLKEVYEGNIYNSPVFEENYYRVWDKRIENPGENKNVVDTVGRELNVESDKVFEKYYIPGSQAQTDPNLLNVDSDTARLDYNVDYDIDVEANPGQKLGYGPEKKLSKIDKSFKYGYLSKLFDGRMFCGGRFQLSRVQIDEGGFGFIFPKEAESLDYFALQFKTSNDFTDKEHPVPQHESDIRIKISFYCKVDNGYKQVYYTHELDKLQANNGGAYNFFGFKLNNNELKRVQGLSIEYEVLRDDYYLRPENPLDHSLMLYELLLPNSSWK